MEIKTTGVAGTLESSDIMVTVNHSEIEGIQIELNSTVEKQYGDAIREVIRETLLQLGITQAQVKAVDKGALDCTIRARIKTAAYRACESKDFVWGGVNNG